MKKSYFRKFFLSLEGSKNFQNNFSTYTVSETLPNPDSSGFFLFTVYEEWERFEYFQKLFPAIRYNLIVFKEEQ